MYQYTIVAEDHTKEINKRFTTDIKGEIINSKWWQLYPDTLSGFAKDAADIELFLKKVENL